LALLPSSANLNDSRCSTDPSCDNTQSFDYSKSNAASSFLLNSSRPSAEESGPFEEEKSAAEVPASDVVIAEVAEERAPKPVEEYDDDAMSAATKSKSTSNSGEAAAELAMATLGKDSGSADAEDGAEDESA
jgi:tricorn protease-like protein